MSQWSDQSDFIAVIVVFYFVSPGFIFESYN